MSRDILNRGIDDSVGDAQKGAVNREDDVKTYGYAHAEVNSGMQIRCKPGVLDTHLISAYEQVSCPEEPLVIGIHSASLVCFDLPQDNFDARNQSTGGVADRSLQCPAGPRILGRGRGHANQNEQQHKEGSTERRTFG